MDIAFIGLGTMGRGIVRNLLGAGHTVTVWNRSPRELPTELAAAKRAATIAEALAGKKRVMVCVTGPEHDRLFECVVRHNEQELGRGSGKSKKSAESQAALAALQKLRNPGHEL